MRKTEKTCTECNRTLPINSFPNWTNQQFRRMKRCNDCVEKSRIRQTDPIAKEKKQKFRDNQRAEMLSRTPYGMKVLKKKLLHGSAARAAYRGMEHTITMEDIIIPEICPILGVPLQPGIRAIHANSPTLDRIDSTKGYIPGNIHVISSKANVMKSNATLAEIEKLYEWMVKNNY